MSEAERDRNTVLIVDDDGAVAAAISRWLERGGFECQTAHSVDQAMERCDGCRFGTVLTDVHMRTRSTP